MGLLDSYKANRAIKVILSSAPASSEMRQAVMKLKQVGRPAVVKLISALETVHDPAPVEAALTGFVDNANLPDFMEALSHDDPRVIAAVTRVLSASDRYDPNRLLPLFENPDASKSALANILLARSDKLDQGELLRLLKTVPSNTRPLIYQVLDQIVTVEAIPDLAKNINSDDPGVRARLARMLARFSSSEASRNALLQLLGDSHKKVRQAALEGLARLTIPVPAKMVVGLLRDPDLAVQSKAIETLIKIKDAATVKYLIEVLQDESEYVRRAAVEVLNEVADYRAVKDLLNALRDKDWWVRVRAGDALGGIGGPKVVEAILELIKDEDEFLRRTAVEILNTSKDERAVDYLVEALKDDDWWVRERAVDALAALGDKRALGPLREMLREDSPASPVVIRALAAMGDAESVDLLIQKLESEDEAIRKEAIRALEQLTDEGRVEQVQEAMTMLINTSDSGVRDSARGAMDTIVARFGERTQFTPQPKSSARDSSAPSGDQSLIDLSVKADHRADIVDASKLVPGQILADRYRIIRKVGKGGFGEVILVEDTVVDDQFILKFLNPHFAADDNMVQRFTHELRYTRKITHPHIIRIYDFIAFGQSYAISMEYFPSHSLADELAARQPLSPVRIARIVLDICEGMSAAQSAGVVHRDLKPANILIDDDDTVKIVDFGLAAAASDAESRLTRSGILVGSPTYMAPEQVRGRAIDSRTDIYSLGVILYEMATGEPPYKGDEPIAILFQHVEGTAVPVRERNSHVSPALEAIIAKAMAVNPDERYQKFDELHADLVGFLQEMS